MPSSTVWRDCDFEYFVKQYGPRKPEELTTDDDALFAVNPHVGGKETHIPMISGALLAQTLRRVVNKSYLKLCLDGKFRLLWNGYVLLTVGVIGKKWGVVDNRYKYTSEFHELGYCIAHTECATAYVALIRAILRACVVFDIAVDAASIKQWHGDMHLGIEKARVEVSTDSPKVFDWAHVTGATTEGRSGILALLKKHLKRKADGAIPHYPFVHDWRDHLESFPEGCSTQCGFQYLSS